MLFRGIKLHKGTGALALFSVPVLLIMLTDNVLSFIVPIEIGQITDSNLLTGLIIGVSSLCAFFSDYLFPPFLKKLSWKIQFIIAAVMALFFPIISAFGIIYSSVWLFVIMNILWGIYYELLIFSQEDFMVEEEDKKDYSRDWSILSSMNVVTNVIGPILASALILMPIWEYTFILIGFVAVALIYSVAILGIQINHEGDDGKKKKRHKFSMELFKEMGLWKELLHDMAPILLLSFMLNWLDMTFFVLGGLFGVELAGENGMEWIIVVLYNLPTIVIMFYLLRRPIEKKKKLFATIALLITGLSFATVGLFVNLGFWVLIPFIIGAFASSVAWPLTRAAISDITRRAGDYKTNVMGIYNAVGSLSCFISPILMGWAADGLGYHAMISLMGVIAVAVSIVLLIIMPKKILVHHQELDSISASFEKR